MKGLVILSAVLVGCASATSPPKPSSTDGVDTAAQEPCCCCDISREAYACTYKIKGPCFCPLIACPPGAPTIFDDEPTDGTVEE